LTVVKRTTYAYACVFAAELGRWIREEFLDEDRRINIFKARVFKDYKHPQPLYVPPGEVIHG